ncbi:CoA transferase [Streptomyces iranensis]|uniref:Crotonobetainyl-CoA:carnitine CoA-transferase CaiB-like acyl-CoA transferase n=1 Tax=Streptomyces iranensis TaxID=576784 RepID=A0ABS4MUS6_9ACTN|nr:CoA transferase [Streptomyces iranensis]MBP2063483.1 crotonobetainyl-CoA:carnitine CoA-transferase CaiB-like acyl-CoA transferase [Streptomyces iranensis]
MPASTSDSRHGDPAGEESLPPVSPGDSRHQTSWLAAAFGAPAAALLGDCVQGPPAGGLRDWADSGAMALTGLPDGAPLAAPGAPAGVLRIALDAVAALSRARTGKAVRLPGTDLLGERAAIAGLSRRGPWSAGGAFRILSAVDGWVGVSLSREDDRDLVAALVENPVETDVWEVLERWSADRRAVDVAERAQLLGIPAATVPVTPRGLPDEQAAHRRGTAGSGPRPVLIHGGGPRKHRRRRPLVVDLTSLWAGPLCARLVGLTGADVVKVESPHRLDGARFGPPAFYDLLHAGHASVSLDLTSPAGVATLRRLLESADVVLEASRPRALRHLGIDAEEAVASGTVWTSITAYGRTGPWANRVGFGDDVAAGAGLVVRTEHGPLPCGDALADPLTGVHAAVSTAAALAGEQGCLIDVSMRDVAAFAARGPAEPHVVRQAPDGDWWVETEHEVFPVRAPRAPRPGQRATEFGADTARVLTRWCRP